MTRPAPLMLLFIASLSGCVSDDGSRIGPTPGARPRDAAPSQMVVNMKDFVDTDQNGYLDTGVATVYLFAGGYALPIDTAGSFVFTLTDPTGGVLAEWAVTPEQAAGCRIKTQVGPGYAFNLDLRPAGAEKSEAPVATMTGQFTDAKGRSARSGRLSVTLGQAR